MRPDLVQVTYSIDSEKIDIIEKNIQIRCSYIRYNDIVNCKGGTYDAKE